MRPNSVRLRGMRSAVACSLAFLLTATGAPDDWEQRFQREFDAKSRPVSELPASLKPAPGKVSLLADFASATNAGVDVYLANLTTDPFVVDEECKVVLERQTTEGWERAEYQLETMICVVPLPGALAPGRMVKMRGYQPAEGQPSTIRFRLYRFSQLEDDQFVTVSGLGLASPMDVELASRDGLSLQTCPLERPIQIATGELVLEPHPGLIRPAELRWQAVRMLGKRTFPEAKLVPVLEELRQDPDETISRDAEYVLKLVRMRRPDLPDEP
jgi:hypothetical protein